MDVVLLDNVVLGNTGSVCMSFQSGQAAVSLLAVAVHTCHTCIIVGLSMHGVPVIVLA